MATVHEVRVALAALLGVGLDLSPAVPYIPSMPTASSVFVRPRRGTDYMTFESPGATFCRPTVALAAVIVGGIKDWAHATEWIDDKVALALTATNTDPTLGGRCSDVAIESIGEPGLIVTRSGDFFAAELRFRPITIA